MKIKILLGAVLTVVAIFLLSRFLPGENGRAVQRNENEAEQRSAAVMPVSPVSTLTSGTGKLEIKIQSPSRIELEESEVRAAFLVTITSNRDGNPVDSEGELVVSGEDTPQIIWFKTVGGRATYPIYLGIGNTFLTIYHRDLDRGMLQRRVEVVRKEGRTV